MFNNDWKLAAENLKDIIEQRKPIENNKENKKDKEEMKNYQVKKIFGKKNQKKTPFWSIFINI